MHWADAPIHFIDFEGSVGSGIVEFGVVTVRWGEVANSRTRLCRPTGRIREEDTAVHGLRSPDLVGEPLFSEEFDFFSTLRETGPLAAHFAHAENSLLKAVWPYPRTSPDFARPNQTATDWGPWIDTGRLYGECFPRLPSARLESLVRAAGVQVELDRATTIHCPPTRCSYHAALYDALAAALLFLDLLKRPEFSEATIPWLLQLSTANPEKRAALQQGELF